MINTIAMLIRTDPGGARDLLREFAAFYRRMLEDNEGLVPLEREVEYALTYLRFEQARFGDRLCVVSDLDPEVLVAQVPAFILQPIVENCVQHGVREEGPLTVSIAAGRVDGDIRVAIADDGVGISEEDLPRVLEVGFGTGLGIALGNVHDRLKGHFGPGSGLSVESERGQGTVVTVTIAFSPERVDR
jgi:LytS/YehU family sensor histidine kinase